MIRKGILKAFDSNTYKASVQVIGSLSVWLDNVAVSAALNSADLVVGRSVVLLMLDPGNPDDCILVGLWGVPQEPPAPGAHENTHTDDASDEIDSALDPRAYPMLAGTLAARPAAGVEGRFYWTTDEHILYRDNGTSWVKVAVADHADLDGIGASDHHAKYTDAEAKAACVSDAPYDGTGWDGVTDVAPSKNAVRDELEGHYAAADPHIGYVLESLFDAKGDIIVATADNMPTRLAVGVDGQVLTADSTQASGTKWATSSAGADNNARILAFMGV